MANSSLVNYVKISPNRGNYINGVRKDGRTDTIKKITVHHMACNGTLEAIGEAFARPARECSSNYAIDSNGKIAMYCEEANRSWCSGNAENDNQAITIEVANDSGAPNWHVSDKAIAKLIDLCTDICKRNGIKKLNFTGDKTGNLTMHKYFQATACPGEYLASKFPYIADEVNKRLAPVPVQNPNKKTDDEIAHEVIKGLWGNGNDRKKRLANAGYNYATVQSRVETILHPNKIVSATIKIPPKASAPKPVAPKKTAQQVAKEVIQGKWGNGNDRKQRLEKAGYNYAAIQAEVNKYYK